jgi:hypothetical protein
MSQLGLFAAVNAPPGLPEPVRRILTAARNVGRRIVRREWGVGVKPRTRTWVPNGDCCCPLGALLLMEGAKCEGEKLSAIQSVAQVLDISQEEVCEFTRGFDGDSNIGYGQWFEYGRMVAKELGFAT